MTAVLYGVCAVAYAALAALVMMRSRANPSRLALSAAGVLTALWAAAAAVQPSAGPLSGAAGWLDLLRLCGWYAVTLHLYRRFVLAQAGAGEARRPGRAFAVMGGLIVLMVSVALLAGLGPAGEGTRMVSVGLAVRLALALCEVLLLENLLRNAPEAARWHVGLAGIGLGAVAVYDIVLCTDAALFGRVSPVLADGRPLMTALAAPLLALAALRAGKAPALAMSRSVAFHSASLVASGVLLLALAGMGEVARAFGTRSGAVAELGLILAGIIAVAVLLSSASGRSRIRARLVDPFFAERYDYRREWLRCIDMLAGAPAGGGAGHEAPLHQRVIRALAQLVDSPAGALFMREPGIGAFQWQGSWNMPAVALPVPPDHPLLLGFAAGEAVALPDRATLMHPPLNALPGLWLAVQLPQAGAAAPAGFVLLAPPRAPFALDGEVFALLRTVAREVAAYLAEQRALKALLEARQLHDFAKRFAFVAHDIKNVASQLALLLANAEHHIDNPAFQRDMLETVRASLRRIGGLLRRLQEPAGPAGAETGRLTPLGRVERIAADCRRSRGAAVIVEAGIVEAGAGEAAACIDPAAFDAAMTHLLDNAVDAGEAAGCRGPVRIVVRTDPGRVVIDIIDPGPGMTPDFIRDELFGPFRSSKREGSGIGAFQARELLREAGGDLIVLSRPGEGTTMRMLLQRAADAALPAAA